MQDRPSAAELLAAVRAFLEDDLLPQLEGRRRFHALVAANVLSIVEREMAQGESHLRAEHARLASLLGAAAHDGTLAALRDAVRGANERLAERIRAGDADAGPFGEAVRAHLRATTEEKLAVANPRYGSAKPG
ncbi:MAG: hypothetical protein KIT14_03780 [bacterium]|nr:hypothetical protein [bacterium]